MKLRGDERRRLISLENFENMSLGGLEKIETVKLESLETYKI